ncbi:putative porin [Flavobacteriaceae bacterium]|nr:putative porin [Flavobacteriaceae bacterium]
MSMQGQTKTSSSGPGKSTNQNENSELVKTIKANYEDYKVINHVGDTVVVDTTLNIAHEYAFNYTRKDQFGNMEFANQGKTYTKLTYEFDNQEYFPKNGTSAKEFGYLTKEDIKYYYVPTPTSEAAYRTGINQGQFLDVFFSSNFTEQFNASLAYRGLRSLGEYRNSLSSQKVFTTTASYHTKNKRYHLNWHYAQHDLFNEENGGLTEESKSEFENKGDFAQDRGNLLVNLPDASSTLDGKRLYLNHQYKFLKQKPDSVQNRMSNIVLKHQMNFEWKKFSFDQETISSSNIFGPSYTDEIEDRNWEQIFDNTLYLAFTSPYILGDFNVNARLTNYKYYFDKSTIEEDGSIIPSSINGDILSLGADWKAELGGFNLEASIAGVISGNLDGNEIDVKAYYKIDSIQNFGGHLLIKSQAPDFNFQIYQSDLVNYNWYNPNLSNENLRSLKVFATTKLGLLEGSYNQIDNFTYLEGSEDPMVKQLSDETVNYYKVYWQKEFKFGKWALNNSMVYQNVISGQNAFRVPDLVTRNTLYYSSYVFKGNPLYLQTGINFNYFTSYYANEFNPVMGSYNVQSQEQIGNYPVLDYFINAQVRRTRIFLKIENFTSSLLAQNYYAAPNYPYRDWRIRFGLIWTWFN